MAQFDYYQNPNPESRGWAPYVVDLQHGMLGVLGTRIMAPLVSLKPSGDTVMKRLNPIISIDGQDYFLSTAEMASIPVSELAEPLGSLVAFRGQILAAVDLIFTAL